MEIRDLKALAAERAANTRFSARCLVLIYMGGSLGLQVLVALVSALTDGFVQDTYGLGGIGLRSILSTVQMLLMLVTMVVPPFWNWGYTRVALETVRGGDPRPGTLLTGFRRFFPGVRLLLLEALVFFALATGAVNIGSILYMVSPLSMLSMGKLNQLDQMYPEGLDLADPAVMDQLISILWPVYLIVGIVMLVLFIPVVYRLRLTGYFLMDGQDRALMNMMESNRAMRRNCLWMFRLDLSFWWYYLLQGLAVVISYGDMLLGGGQVLYWVCFLVSVLAQLAVSWAFLPRVEAAYALAYEQLKTKQETRYV